MISLKRKIKLALFTSCLMTSTIAFSESNKIDAAINVVESLCLSGSGYGIEADLEGNITIKNFKPKGSGSVTLNVRETNGATAFQDELRIIADDKVRGCTQKHIGRILDAVLESIKSSKAINKNNKSLSSAKYLGYVPDQVIVQSFTGGSEILYYRFSVKEPANIKISFSRNSQSVSISLLTEKNLSITRGTYSDGRSTENHFLMLGDYYISVKTLHENKATAFKMVVEGFPEA